MVEKKYDELKMKVLKNNTISLIDIEESLKTLKTGKAPGFDLISPDLLRFGNCIMLNSILANVYNDIIKYGLEVDNFNISVITPIPKSKKITDNPDDYRPISVSSVFCTLFEKIILIQFGYKYITSCKHASLVLKLGITTKIESVLVIMSVYSSQKLLIGYGEIAYFLN